jgi:hypothetical protein
MAEKKIQTSAGMETATETVNRIKGALAAPSNTTPTTNGSDSPAFMEAVQKKLIGQADIISSADTQIESYFQNAQDNLRSANESSAARIESQFGREFGYAQDKAQSEFRDFSESRSGFGTQMVAFRRLVETTDKNLNDLEQRKQELLLQGDANTASEIAKMQIEALKFKQTAQQNTFSNLLGLGKFAQDNQQMALAERRFGLETQQFDLSTQQFALSKSRDTFERITKFQDSGVLSSMSESDIAGLAKDAGLPASAMKAISSLPPKQEIRAVGDTLLAIDPVTMKTKVLYRQPAKASESDMVSLGSDGKVSYMTSSVMQGLQKLEDLTPTQQAEVKSEMAKAGFANQAYPKWFRDQLQVGSIQTSQAPIDAGAGTNVQYPSGQATYTEGFVQKEWEKYRESFVVGPRFINEQFMTGLFKLAPEGEKLADKAKDADMTEEEYTGQIMSTIEMYREAGMTDREILKLFQ